LNHSNQTQGVINHAELLEKLSKALVKIGSVLPRTKLNSELYQTTLMKEAVSRLYAYIILFFQRAVKWYNMSSASRAIASIFKPFELDYKDTVEQIKLCSETVDKIASASGRAEVRDMHIMLQLQQEMLSRRDEKLEDMQKQMKDMQHQMNTTTDKVSQILQVATGNFPCLFNF
jgi:predicted phage tail protein